MLTILTHHGAGGHLEHLLQTRQWGGEEVLNHHRDQHLPHHLPDILVDAGATEPVVVVHVCHTPTERLKLKVRIKNESTKYKKTEDIEIY